MASRRLFKLWGWMKFCRGVCIDREVQTWSLEAPHIQREVGEGSRREQEGATEKKKTRGLQCPESVCFKAVSSNLCQMLLKVKKDTD